MLCRRSCELATMYFIRASAVLWPPNEKTRNLVIALMFVVLLDKHIGRRSSAKCVCWLGARRGLRGAHYTQRRFTGVASQSRLEPQMQTLNCACATCPQACTQQGWPRERSLCHMMFHTPMHRRRGCLYAPTHNGQVGATWVWKPKPLQRLHETHRCTCTVRVREGVVSRWCVVRVGMLKKWCVVRVGMWT
jgi:hypothetical protein